jgi:hypothetical protein
MRLLARQREKRGRCVAILIRLQIERMLPPQELRCDVAGGASDGAGVSVRLASERCLARDRTRTGAHRSRETKVDDPYATVRRDHDVGWLEIAMYDAGGVRGGEAAARFDQHPQHLDSGPFSLQPVPQGFARDELHRDENAVVVNADVVCGHHVGMAELRERPPLREQPIVMLTVRFPMTLVQKLERDVAGELRIVRAVDGAHTTASQHLGHPITADSRARR